MPSKTQIKSNDELFLDQALGQAQIALLKDEVPVGCVVIQDNKIVSRAHNLTNTLNDPLAHAEYLCLKQIIKENYCVENLTFYITLEPCVMCYGILERIGAKIIYGYENEIFGTKKLINKIPGLCLNDQRCIEILKEFYKTENTRTAHLRTQ